VKRTTSLLGIIGWFFSAALVTACSEPGQPEESQTGSEPKPAVQYQVEELEPPVGRLQQPIHPIRYQLELHIDPRQDSFAGAVAIDLVASERISGFWIHGKALEVAEAWVVDGTGSRLDVSYQERLASGVARLTLEQAVEPGPLTLHMTWSAKFNVQPNALFRVERGADYYAATQFQPIAARQVFPGFDEPRFKVPFDITVISPTGDVAISNSPERSAEDLGNGYTRHTFETTRPLPTYLLAFAVGPYDLVDHGKISSSDIRNRDLPLRAIAARGQGSKLAYALENTAGILNVLEDYFGSEYPYRKLDLIAVPTAFGGAMENAGAITYDEYLLLMDSSAALDQRRSFTSVHGHELGHMWFGDLVTPEWWNDLWLNESFATWISYKAAHEVWPEGQFDRSTLRGGLRAMKEDSLAAARQIREPVTHNDAIADSFDSITYQKGGGVLAMLERYIGEEEFQSGIRLHMQRYADDVANAEDFIASVAEGSGRAEVESAFKSFVEQPGVPLIEIKVNCETDRSPIMQVRQSRYAPLGSAIDPEESQWLIPMCVTYRDGDESKSECAMLNERQRSIPLAASNCPSSLHPNADGAGYYRFTMEQSWWQGLIDGLSEMSAAEALVVADSLDAAFRAGTVSADTYVEGMTALLNQDSWDVVEAGLDNLESILTVLQLEELPAVQRALSALARPRYERLSDEEGDAADLLNSRIQRFLTMVAKDPALREPLAERASRRIGLEGEPDPMATPQSELETVLSVGVQDLGAPFFEKLLELAVASEDRAFRYDAFGALARTEDPTLAARLQQVILSGQLQGYEPLQLLSRQMARAATTDLTYTWLRANFEAILQLVPEEYRGLWVVGLGANFCSVERATEWSEFIESRAADLPGYERSLAQAIESVNLCAALRGAKARELITELTGR
jgi:alanyl aminopeptidase